MKNISIVLISSLLFWSCSNHNQKIGYVENYKLHSSFTLTTELDQEFQAYSDAISVELDSLKLAYENMTKGFDQLDEIPKEAYQSYMNLKNNLIYVQKTVDDKIIEKKETFETQIWERLNNYIKEFSEENGYDFIIGADGSGHLMYAKETANLTDDLILFSNNKYNGKK